MQDKEAWHHRSNGDILLALSKALHKQQNNSSEENPGIPTTSDYLPCSDNVVLDQVAEHINASFQTKYLQEDKVVPFQFDH